MRSRKPFALGLDPALYNPQGLKAVMQEEGGLEAVQHEYARLRREANQRLTRLGRSEFADSKAYRMNKDRFVRLDEIKPGKNYERDLARLTQEAARFVQARASSASGQRGIRREALDTLHENGVKWVNTKNFKQFTQMMEELRAKQLDRTFYSIYAPASDEEPQEDKQERARALKSLFDEWQSNGGTFGEGMKTVDWTNLVGRYDYSWLD